MVPGLSGSKQRQRRLLQQQCDGAAHEAAFLRLCGLCADALRRRLRLRRDAYLASAEGKAHVLSVIGAKLRASGKQVVASARNLEWAQLAWLLSACYLGS